MKDFMITFKLMLKQSMSIDYMAYKIKQNKRFRNMFIIIAVILLSCLPSYILLLKGLVELYKIYQTLNFQSLFIVMAIILSLFLIILFGMFQIISYFYFSKDIKILTPLPIKPKHYLVSKFFIIYLWELIISLFLVAPIFIIYGIYENIYPYQWITMILGLLCMPIIPLVIVGFITIILMRITNASKNKDALRMVGYIVLMASLLAFQYFVYRNLIPDDPNEQIEIFINLVENSTYFLERFSLYYPVTKLINYTISGNVLEALLGLILLVIISLMFVYLFSLFLEKVFIITYLKEHSQDTLKKKVRKSKVRSISFAIARIDFITIIKEPVFLFNTLAMIVILPLLIVISSLVTSSSGELNQLTNLYKSFDLQIWLVVTLFLIITTSMIPLTSTTFSREGKNNWIMRTLPISPKDHILGRMITPIITHLLLNFIMIVLVLLFLYRGGIEVGSSILYAILCFVVSLTLSLPLLLIFIYIDLKRPMLKWENPQQPVKQNMNVLIGMGIGFVYGILLFLSYHFVLRKFIDNAFIFIIYLILGIILTIRSYKFLEKNFNQNLIKMD